MSASADGLLVFGGIGGGLQGLREGGVPCEWMTTGSGEGKKAVFVPDKPLDSWGSAREGV